MDLKHYYNYSYWYKNSSYLHHMNLDWTANYNKLFVPQVERKEMEDLDYTDVPIFVDELVFWRRREYPRNIQIRTADLSYRRGRKDSIRAFLNNHTDSE